MEPQVKLGIETFGRGLGVGKKVLFTSVYTGTVTFYPRDAMLARVFATATSLSVCLDVRHTPVLCLAERKQDREMYTV